jgi:hypothetical protein
MSQKKQKSGEENIESTVREDTGNTPVQKFPVSGNRQPNLVHPPQGVPDAGQSVGLRTCDRLLQRLGPGSPFVRSFRRMGNFLAEWDKIPKQSDYPQMFEQLQSVLLKHGGTSVESAGPDGHVKGIVKFGKVIRPKCIRKHRGKESRCHQNVAELHLAETYEGARIATGYGLSVDDVWRSHSWLVRGNDIIETTESRVLYFGRVLPMEAALAFCLSEASAVARR